MNFPVTIKGRCKNDWKTVNELCKMCNYNQELKVKLLAEFVPISERNYNKEIEHYKAQLDNCFKLCNKCDHLLYDIFMKERQDFLVPRKLNANRKANQPGKFALIVNFILSLCLTFSAYMQMYGINGFPWDHYSNLTYRYLIKNAAKTKIVLNNIPKWNVYSSALNQCSVLLISGFAFNVYSAYQTRSNLITLNAVSWAFNMFLNFYSINLNGWNFSLEAVSGIISCLICAHIFFDVKTPKKSKIEPKPKFNGFTSKTYVPATSTPVESPNQSFSHFEEQVLPQLNKSNIENSTKREGSIETRIKGLNIGDGTSKGVRPLYTNGHAFTNPYPDDYIATPYWWEADNSASIFSSTAQHSKAESIKSGKSGNFSSRFVNDMPQHRVKSFTFFPPSLSKTSRSNRDMDTLSSPSDECMSCSGHSVHCRRFSNQSYTPSYFNISPTPTLHCQYRPYSRHM